MLLITTEWGKTHICILIILILFFMWEYVSQTIKCQLSVKTGWALLVWQIILDYCTILVSIPLATGSSRSSWSSESKPILLKDKSKMLVCLSILYGFLTPSEALRPSFSGSYWLHASLKTSHCGLRDFLKQLGAVVFNKCCWNRSKQWTKAKWNPCVGQ